MNSTVKQRKWLFGLIFLVVFILAGISFYRSRHLPEPVVLGEGVTEVKRLSNYFSGIKGSINDARIYVLGQETDGGSVLILGGSHPDVACGWQNLGMLEFQAGKLKAAAGSYHEACRIAVESLGNNHPTTQNLVSKYNELQTRLKAEETPSDTAETDEEEGGVMTGNWRTIAFDSSLNLGDDTF
mgnify:CR=1 FL=1